MPQPAWRRLDGSDSATGSIACGISRRCSRNRSFNHLRHLMADDYIFGLGTATLARFGAHHVFMAAPPPEVNLREATISPNHSGLFIGRG